MKNKNRIFIVDDIPDNLHLLKQILQDDYKLSFATSGKNAIKAIEIILPDLILLDIMMPKMDGFEVCRKLKSKEKTREIPIIFLTANVTEEIEIKGFELGAADYINKPISAPIVKARVKNLLELRNARKKIEEKNIKLKEQNSSLVEAASLREDMERMTRHDLKTPLYAVISFPKIILLENNNLNDKHKKYLKMIESSGLRMLSMINLSLDLFKMERGIYSYKPVAVNIEEIIKRVIGETENMASKKDLIIDVQLDKNFESGTSILGEELLCYMIMENLIKNAIEASPQKERITIILKNDNRMVSIKIINKGSVPENIKNRFFDKYVTSGKQKGTGLGTYSAKLMVETQKGDIHLNSSKDVTSIIVMLPS